MFKVEITVEIQDADNTKYSDPKGYERVELYCVDIFDLFSAMSGVVNSLLKVCHVKYQADFEKKNESE